MPEVAGHSDRSQNHNCRSDKIIFIPELSFQYKYLSDHGNNLLNYNPFLKYLLFIANNTVVIINGTITDIPIIIEICHSFRVILLIISISFGANVITLNKPGILCLYKVIPVDKIRKLRHTILPYQDQLFNLSKPPN